MYSINPQLHIKIFKNLTRCFKSEQKIIENAKHYKYFGYKKKKDVSNADLKCIHIIRTNLTKIARFEII